MHQRHESESSGMSKATRREFLGVGAVASGLFLGQPLVGVRSVEAAAKPRVLLKHGLLVDGTGKKGVVGDLLLNGTKIEALSETPIDADCPSLDCTGKVISPGFIDMHSHMDWVLALEGQAELKSPFTAQGCTTFVAGNCGWASGGFRRDSEHKKRFNPGIFPEFEMPWNSMEEYYEHLGKVGMSHNLINMGGHGTVRLSMRWDDPSPLRSEEMAEMLTLLEKAMDQGASGVSLGLQYNPGIFAPPEELEEVARLVQKKDKLLTVHGRAYSAFAPGHKINLLGDTHNVLSLVEMLDLARKTGVRLQYSHLMFAGTASHWTYRRCLELIDEALAEGVDVATDTYPYHCGNTGLGVVTPKWFREDLPGNYHNEAALKRLKMELDAMTALLGFGYEDIQVTYCGHPDFDQYNGMFLADIAKERGADPFDTAVELMEKSSARRGRGPWVLLHKYSNMEIIDALIRHPNCLFMSDAVPAPWLMNPAAYGAFPLLLQYARDRKLISLEEAVRKSTGACADRVRVKDRGYLCKGLAADITVFDWNAIKDNNTLKDTGNAPDGIETVFMNGVQVLKDGTVEDGAKAGVVVRT